MTRLPALLVLVGLTLPSPLCAADWPAWRYDAQRSAASPEELPAELHLQWVRRYPPLAPAWPDQEKMQFDIAYEPVVLGKTLFINSSRHDCVTALDTATGAERWRFFADAPVRFAPAAWEGRVYFTADDGHLYCLDAAAGKLLWKFRGGPSDRMILGNDRLISTWPARGAPVIADGTVYFAASIWPFMGIFIHALDARTGQVVWTNDGDGSLYMKQPHNADSFATIAPQGPLVVDGKTLLIPGGRSLPALFDRATGKFLKYQLAENGKRGGGSEVAALGDVFFNGGAVFELASQKYLAELSKHVVLTPDVVYAYSAGACHAYDFAGARTREVEAADAKGVATKTTRWTMEKLASCKTPVAETLIKAGRRLYLGADGQVQAIDLDLGNQAMTPGWQVEVEGRVVRLVAADERLFAVTREGGIYCFGADRRAGGVSPLITGPSAETCALANRHQEADAPRSPADGPRPAADRTAAPDDERAATILTAAGLPEGYAVVLGADEGGLIRELARQSKLHIVVVEPSAAKVQELRAELTAEDLYGTRIAVVPGDAAGVSLPPYFANLIVGDAAMAANRAVVTRLFEALRPYGGTVCFLDGTRSEGLRALAAQAGLANAQVKTDGHLTLLTRVGPLPGSANWTHEHADAANTRVSKDQLVKAPLGLLWFGGPSHEGILPRHGHGPQPQVSDGRLIIEGVDLIRALDIYTGRLLWETRIPGVGRFFNNLAHQAGANASGSNFVSAPDGIYVVHEKKCLVLDPATGAIAREFQLPRLEGMKESPRWGYINVAGDYLIGGADPLLDPKRLPKPPTDPRAGDDKDPAPTRSSSLSRVLALLKNFSPNLSASRHLVVMNRHTGRVLWTRSASYAFRHNGICAGGGRVYAIDRLSGEELNEYLKDDRTPPYPPRLMVFDLATGDPLWKTDADVFGTWLSYSAKHDVVVEAGRVARDTLSDEPRGMRAYRAGSGKVLWFDQGYAGPAMIHGDTILQGQGACDLLTGALKKRVDPITRELVPWTWTRNYGCNTPLASEHLMTFRSGAAGYFDLCNDGGTGNFGGFRSSCTNNLIVAGGVLTAAEYTRTCTCAYQNQTSVGLVHLPEAEMWTFAGAKELKGQVQRLGVNFGAPGDRKADDGTLWLEYPFTGGVSPAVTVATTPKAPDVFRRHSALVQGKLPFVAGSGLVGIQEINLLLDKVEGARSFTVRLVFLEPEPMQPGRRVFDVAIQGRPALDDFDIVKEAAGAMRTVVKEFSGVAVEDMLTIRFTPASAASAPPLVCGIEVIAESRK